MAPLTVAVESETMPAEAMTAAKTRSVQKTGQLTVPVWPVEQQLCPHSDDVVAVHAEKASLGVESGRVSRHGLAPRFDPSQER
jgi:hypothetical protein